jgi:hypothetical protein
MEVRSVQKSSQIPCRMIERHVPHGPETSASNSMCGCESPATWRHDEQIGVHLQAGLEFPSLPG